MLGPPWGAEPSLGARAERQAGPERPTTHDTAATTETEALRAWESPKVQLTRMELILELGGCDSLPRASSPPPSVLHAANIYRAAIICQALC